MLLNAHTLEHTRLSTRLGTGFAGQESSYMYAFTHARSHSLENPSSKACGKKVCRYGVVILICHEKLFCSQHMFALWDLYTYFSGNWVNIVLNIYNSKRILI